MRLLAAVLVLTSLAGGAWAQWFNFGEKEDKPAAVTEAPGSRKGSEVKSARVRWLDKQTNRLQEVIVAAGSEQTIGSMNVRLTRCLADYGGVPLRDVAWLEVKESERDTPWFAGWMFNDFPEVATMDHPRFDIQLIGCGDKARAKPATKVVQPKDTIISTSVPMEAPVEEVPLDSEAPGATQGSVDPYYVPGIERPNQETPPPADAEPAVDSYPAAMPSEAPTEIQPMAPVEEQPTAEQGDLHQMMDGTAQ